MAMVKRPNKYPPEILDGAALVLPDGGEAVGPYEPEGELAELEGG